MGRGGNKINLLLHLCFLFLSFFPSFFFSLLFLSFFFITSYLFHRLHFIMQALKLVLSSFYIKVNVCVGGWVCRYAPHAFRNRRRDPDQAWPEGPLSSPGRFLATWIGWMPERTIRPSIFPIQWHCLLGLFF